MRHVLLSLSLFLLAPLAAAAQFGSGPVQPASETTAVAGAPSGTPVSVDIESLAANQAGDQVWLPGSSKAIPARVTRVVQRPDGSLAWTARVPAAVGEQTATIVEKNGHVFGLIPQSSGPALRLETRHGQSRIVTEKSFVRPGGPDVLLPPEPTPAQRALRKSQEATQAEGTPRIDVLVAYQPSLVEVWGSVAAVQARIAYLETITNQAYVDTGMDLEVRVVATHLLDFAADADNVDALYAITDPSNLAVKQEIDRVRAMYGADLVKLMRNFDRVNQTSCGVGWLGGYHGNPFIPEYGFSVTADLGFGGDGCGEWTFAHEIGHNQGAHHDIETTGGDYGAFEYSRGHRQTISADSGFATIMAYDVGPQERLGRFSDPDLLECLGQPCGIADEADNARGIAETAALVAGLLPELSNGTLPQLSLDDVQVVEGNSGQRPARFMLSLSSAAAGPVNVNLATRPASATNGDFVPRSYSILIPAGQTAVTIDVGVRGDTLREPDEVFSLDILAVSGAGIAKGQGIATIVSDDPVPTLSIADIRIQEGDDGLRDAVFTARLSYPSNQPVRFDVEAGPFDATPVLDFRPMRRLGLEIPPGSLATQFTVAVIGDAEVEGEESFYVTVGGVNGARIDDSIIRARIVDDDAAGGPGLPRLTVQPASIIEGSAGPRDADVVVSLNAPAPAEVSFALLAEGITATAGQDFDASGLGAFVIPLGSTSVQVPLRVIGDTLDEVDEILQLRPGNVVGAVPAVAPAVITLIDDDGSAQTAPLAARDDRFVLLENAGASRLAVLANDAAAAAALAGGLLQISEQPVIGQVQVDTNGTSSTVADDVLVYIPASDLSYEDRLAYRLCDVSGHCAEGMVQVLVRPVVDPMLASEDGSGFADVQVSGLRDLPELQVHAGYRRIAKPRVHQLAVDPTPETPWDDSGTATQVHFFEGGYGSGTFNFTVVADVNVLQDGNVDLYAGIDDNGNGRADPDEVRCVSAMDGLVERCEMPFALSAATGGGYWVRLHNRGNSEVEVRSLTAAVQHSLDPGLFPEQWVATSPSRAPDGEAFPVRLAWLDPQLRPGDALFGFLDFKGTDGESIASVPVRMDRDGSAVPARNLDLIRNFGILAPGGKHDRLFVDVPEGVATLRLWLSVDGPASFRLLRTEAGPGPVVPAAPAQAEAMAEFERSQASAYEYPNPPAGRWYVEVSNIGAADVFYDITSSFSSGTNAAAIMPGSYFNPTRSGHGLFIYPAGDQLVGLWYTYLQDGTPTWYYLQGLDLGNGGYWFSQVHRSNWDGQANRLTRIGSATVNPHPDGVIFTYRLDGEQGSELLSPLGSGCPTLGGQPVDASSHWFDPAKAGTGYSVQLFPDYEFYAAFVYDNRGVARFLTSEAGSFRGADATIPLEQLTGFCPLCERTGAPTRADIGTLRRRFDASGLVQMQLDAIYTGGVPGAWTGNDVVQPLGGLGTTQGCAVPN